MVLTLAPLTIAATEGVANPEGWVDKITEYVLMQKAVAKEGSYDPYLSELQVAKAARDRGDWAGQYESMNRFIDKLDAREGGISAKSAKDIREYTFQVEPKGLHEQSRDLKIHPEVKKWQDRMARQREEAERSF
jgi:hypothetical protein